MPYFMNSPHKSILAALYDCFPAANAVLVFLLDHPLAWFTPKWRRKGRMALKAVRRYINYNRDLLPPERLAEFEESRDLLKTALYRGDRQRAETITAKLESTLESIPGAVPSALAENVEVLFVILYHFPGFALLCSPALPHPDRFHAALPERNPRPSPGRGSHP